MKIGYYPGCSLDSTAIEYNESVKSVSSLLDIDLKELNDWNCCGATSAHCIDEKVSFKLAVRNLEIAEREGLDVAVPCSGCFSRLKFAEKDALYNEKYKGQSSFTGNISIIDMVTLFAGEEILEKIEERVVKKLTGLRVAAYYGCMSLRPPKITDAADHENPSGMEKIMEAIGAEPVEWPYKSLCCGGSLVLTRTDIVKNQVYKIMDMVEESGADCIVTSCPMCQSNLDTRSVDTAKEYSRDFNIPILYFTELVGLALGSESADDWFLKHFVSPDKLFNEKGLVKNGS